MITRSQRIRALLAGAVLAAAAAAHAAPAVDVRPVGVLVLAHGGSPEWNHEVVQVAADAKLPYPSEVAFGMGMHAGEVDGMQQAIERLERAGASRIVVLPLLVSSHSEVMDQFAYLFGLHPHGPWEAEVKPLVCRVPVTLASPLDDDPVVSSVLEARARALSRRPERESLVLIAHGPVSDAHNAQWLGVMDRLAERLQQAVKFQTVASATLRDDAPTPVRDAAVQHLRELVQRLGYNGDVLVLPLLLSKGGIERKIPTALEGLPYRYAGETLLPHPEFSAWLRSRIDAAANQPASGTSHTGG